MIRELSASLEWVRSARSMTRLIAYDRTGIHMFGIVRVSTCISLSWLVIIKLSAVYTGGTMFPWRIFSAVHYFCPPPLSIPRLLSSVLCVSFLRPCKLSKLEPDCSKSQHHGNGVSTVALAAHNCKSGGRRSRILGTAHG